MAEKKKRDDEMFDELADAASLFDEIDSLPERDDIGDILFVEGIEDDEPVVDEDIMADEPAVVTRGPESAQPVFDEPGKTMTVAEKLAPRRRPLPKRRIEPVSTPEPAVVSSPTNGMTVGEFFAPLVRHSPAAKIRIEAETIGSVFQGFIR